MLGRPFAGSKSGCSCTACAILPGSDGHLHATAMAWYTAGVDAPLLADVTMPTSPRFAAFPLSARPNRGDGLAPRRPFLARGQAVVVLASVLATLPAVHLAPATAWAENADDLRKAEALATEAKL